MEPSVSIHQEIILVVDDDQAICTMLQAGIQMAGYQCFVSQSPSQALALLDKQPVDVVVSDIQMPEMSGIELEQIIKTRYQADVIIMTGFVDDFNYEDIIAQGASDFIHKPVRLAEFVARLKRVLAERASRSKLKSALEDLQLNLGKSQRAMDGIVQALSMTVEMRDPYTAGHQQRVASLACAVAETMGFSEDEIYGLRMASEIHDLGKITVPSEILSKPGHLSDLEYQLIKNHAQAGYDILKQIEFPWPIAEIILQHHERMNGSGYPQGLNGDQILSAARILSVADVFETIASHRPYRPSLGVERAMDEIKSQSGILYDKQVAEAFLELINAGRFEVDGDSWGLDCPLDR